MRMSSVTLLQISSSVLCQVTLIIRAFTLEQKAIQTDLLCEFFSNLKSLAYEPKHYELSTRTGFEEEAHMLLSRKFEETQFKLMCFALSSDNA